MKITCANVEQTIKDLGEKFKSFHLSPCFCGAPVWQQPCPVCGFYPAYGQTNSSKKKDGCSFAEFQRIYDYQDNILEWYLNSFMRCVDPQESKLDAAREKAKRYEWPTAAELWEHFTGQTATISPEEQKEIEARQARQRIGPPPLR